MLPSSTFIILTSRKTFTSFMVIIFITARSRSQPSDMIAAHVEESVEDSAAHPTTTPSPTGRRAALLDEQPSPSSTNEPTISTEDVRCQAANGDFLESATDCEDQDHYCEENFLILTSRNSSTASPSHNKRPGLCENPELYEEALQCAQTCKLCCERPDALQKVAAASAASNATAALTVEAAPPAPAAVEALAAAVGLQPEGLSESLKLLQEQSAVQQHQQTTTTIPPPVSPPSSRRIAQNASGGSFLLECRFAAGQCTSDETWIVTLIRACPRTCGICNNLAALRSRGPLTESVDVRNATACRDKHLTCADVKPTLCEDSEHGLLFQRRCPVTCQKCVPSLAVNETVCEDRADDCQEPEKIALCRNPQYRTLLKRQCQKTCKFCVDTSPGSGNSDDNKRTAQPQQLLLRSNNNGTGSAELPPTPQPISGSACVDRSRNCPLWNNRGFCSSTFYEERTKSDWCSFTCRLCVTTK